MPNKCSLRMSPRTIRGLPRHGGCPTGHPWLVDRPSGTNTTSSIARTKHTQVRRRRNAMTCVCPTSSTELQRHCPQCTGTALTLSTAGPAIPRSRRSSPFALEPRTKYPVRIHASTVPYSSTAHMSICGSITSSRLPSNAILSQHHQPGRRCGQRRSSTGCSSSTHFTILRPLAPRRANPCVTMRCTRI